MTQDWAAAAFAHLAGDQPATGEPMEQPLPHACSYCGHTEFETPVDNGRGATATCKNCGGSMSSWGGQWTPELIGDPSNHPSPKVDPRSGAGGGQNYLLDPDGRSMFPDRMTAFSAFEITAAEERPRYRYRQTVQTANGYEPFSDGTRGPFHGAEPTGHHTAMPKIRRSRNAEIAEAAAVAGTTVYRGLHGDHAHEAAEATRQGASGSGDHGPGIYVSSSPYEALQHAREYHHDDRGVVMRGRIHPDAKVVHRDTAPPEAWSGKAANDWARSQGHDVMTDGFGVHVVLNPSVLEWEPKNYSVDEGFKKFTDVYHHGAFSAFELVAAERPSVVHDPEDHDVSDGEVFIAADTVEASLHHTADGPEQDYRMMHQAPDSDYGAPLHDVEKIMPDFYTHPHYYDHGQEYQHESVGPVMKARGNPEAKIRIYRALPAEHAGGGFNTGDWVTTSKSYAREHARQNGDPNHDWPVIRTTVPAKHLHTEGDIHEWAYNGPRKEVAMLAHPGGYHQEVRQRADGSIAPVKRRPKKPAAEDPLKGFSIQHHESDVNTDTHRHHVFAYDAEENYAGQLHANHGKEPDSVHVEPKHEGSPLEQRMREAIPHLRQASKTAAADWCAHRHLGSCYWPGDNPAVGKIPQRRGTCNWTTAWEQQLCPISDPGPMAGMFVKGTKAVPEAVDAATEGHYLKPVRNAGFLGYVEGREGDHEKYKGEMAERYGDDARLLHRQVSQESDADRAVGSHPKLHDFAGEKYNYFWQQHGRVGPVDLSKGVYATQPYVVQEHVDRYTRDPHAKTVFQEQIEQLHEEDRPHTTYPGNHMPMFVRHEGNLYTTEGHHRVAAALHRGDTSIHGITYDFDEHENPAVDHYNKWKEEPPNTFSKYSSAGISCDFHDMPEGEFDRHCRANHDDGICVETEYARHLGNHVAGAHHTSELLFHFTATWADVRDKAKRIRREGGVRILMASSEGVVSEVRGDNAVYETTLTYVPGSSKVGTWNCGCRWAAYAWGRSPKYRRFEGRMCSHALAVQYEAQARSAHGREIMPDATRPDWLKQRTPVAIQHQRDRNLDMTRREVPPGNMRRVFSMWEVPVDGSEVGSASSMVDGQLQSTASDSDLHMTVQRALDQAHDSERERHQDDATYAENNEPLHKSDIPEEHRAGWRFHRNVEAAPPLQNLFADIFGSQKEFQHEPPVSVTQYRHPASREPLHLDEHGNSWRRHYEWTRPDAKVPEFTGWTGPHSAAETLREHPTWSVSHGEDGTLRQHQRTHEERLKMTGTDPTESHEDVVLRRNRTLREHGWGVVSSKVPGDGAVVGHAGSMVAGHREATPIQALAAQLVEDGADGVAVMRELLGLGMAHAAAQRLTRTALGLTVAASVCPECHGPVAPHASLCPHCGARLTPSDVPDAHLATANPDARGTVYLRFGHWPKDERSHNNVTGFKEEGVSVYDLDEHGNPKDPDPHFSRGHEHDEYCDEDCQMHLGNEDYGNDTLEEMQGRVHRAESDRFNGRSHPSNLPHLVRGEMVGIGHDGEPLLRNVKRVGDWIDHRHHFVPGAEPHPLARDEHHEDYEPPSPRGRKLSAKEKALPGVAGVVLKALDTGRILMLQRGLDDENDPARGTWEFPGGHVEDGDVTTLHGAIREWQEEVGQQFPEGGAVVHSWVSPNGVYAGYVVLIPSEKDVSMKDGRVVPNPDDPKGDHHEQAAWWELAHAKKNPALRPECKEGTPWKDIERAGEGMKAAALNPFDFAFTADIDEDRRKSELRYTHEQNFLHNTLGPEYHPNDFGGQHQQPWGGVQRAHDDAVPDEESGLTPRWPHAEPARSGWIEKFNPDDPAHHRDRGNEHMDTPGGLPIRSLNSYDINSPLQELTNGLPSEPPPHSNSENPASTGFATSEDPDSWADPQPGRSDLLVWSSQQQAMLHDEPEPALPSTDGEREAPLPPGTLAPTSDQQTMRHGYDDLTEFREDHPEAIPHTGGVTAIVAAFQQTAGAQALATGSKEKDKVDIASAARQFLAGKTAAGAGAQKTALKDFNHAEQQALINEGSHDGTAARNLADLRIEGTHYSALEAALREQEKDGVDPADIFVL